MISYEGIIRKRLRLKGHPEIPPYVDETDLQAAGAAEPSAVADANVEAVEVNRTKTGNEDDERIAAQGSDGSQPEADANDVPEKQDTRTEAQKRHDEIAQQREKERLRKVAEKSYREHVEDFNKRLTEEPEHYDLFKTSFTK